MKKYELTDETITKFGIKLYRIRACKDLELSIGERVKKGDLGGYIEKESNLSQDGNAWVCDNAWVVGNAWVDGNARVVGNAWVVGNARVGGNAWVDGNARVGGDARVGGNAWVDGNARVVGNARVGGDARVDGNARVVGNARVGGDARVDGNAFIVSNNDYLCFRGLGSQNRNTTFFKCKDGTVRVACGCFRGDLDEFEAKVKETHGENKYAKEYLACINVAKIHFEELHD